MSSPFVHGSGQRQQPVTKSGLSLNSFLNSWLVMWQIYPLQQFLSMWEDTSLPKKYKHRGSMFAEVFICFTYLPLHCHWLQLRPGHPEVQFFHGCIEVQVVRFAPSDKVVNQVFALLLLFTTDSAHDSHVIHNILHTMELHSSRS